ncbi:hypothetical protein BC827DRAFT_1151797 [Russula dissimulans]|nr:hypothetical protein BC827DRAFT_1151797 [Russula dissimulans]
MSAYDPYLARHSLYRAPSARSYFSYPGYATSSPYSVYTTTDDYYRSTQTGVVSERMYFGLNGKLIRSYKIRSFRRAQKHVLNLFPDLLQGVASSRIQFYVTRPGYSGGHYVGFKSYISKHAWLAEIDSLAEHDTVGIEVRPSVSFTETVENKDYWAGPGMPWPWFIRAGRTGRANRHRRDNSCCVMVWPGSSIAITKIDATLLVEQAVGTQSDSLQATDNWSVVLHPKCSFAFTR